MESSIVLPSNLARLTGSDNNSAHWFYINDDTGQTSWDRPTWAAGEQPREGKYEEHSHRAHGIPDTPYGLAEKETTDRGFLSDLAQNALQQANNAEANQTPTPLSPGEAIGSLFGNKPNQSSQSGGGLMGSLTSALQPKPPPPQPAGLGGLLDAFVGNSKPPPPPKPQGLAGVLSSALSHSGSQSGSGGKITGILASALAGNQSSHQSSGLGGMISSALAGGQQSQSHQSQSSGLGGMLSSTLSGGSQSGGAHQSQSSGLGGMLVNALGNSGQQGKSNKVANLLASALSGGQKDIPSTTNGGANPGSFTHVPSSGDHGAQDFSANTSAGGWEWQGQQQQSQPHGQQPQGQYQGQQNYQMGQQGQKEMHDGMQGGYQHPAPPQVQEYYPPPPSGKVSGGSGVGLPGAFPVDEEENEHQTEGQHGGNQGHQNGPLQPPPNAPNGQWAPPSGYPNPPPGQYASSPAQQSQPPYGQYPHGEQTQEYHVQQPGHPNGSYFPTYSPGQNQPTPPQLFGPNAPPYGQPRP